jgi:hypothetical protein
MKKPVDKNRVEDDRYQEADASPRKIMPILNDF